jgi:hypothetical protein
MEDPIPTERATAEVGTGVSIVIVSVITLLHPLKDIAISTASRLTERRAPICVELIAIITALYSRSHDPVSAARG